MAHRLPMMAGAALTIPMAWAFNKQVGRVPLMGPVPIKRTALYQPTTLRALWRSARTGLTAEIDVGKD